MSQEDYEARFRRLLRSVKTVRDDAAREAAWAAFDAADAVADQEAAQTIAENLSQQLAVVAGVKAAGLAVYRQRGRDMISYRDKIRPLGRSISPLTIAKTLREAVRESGAINAPVVDIQLLEALRSSNKETRSAVINLVRMGDLS